MKTVPNEVTVERVRIDECFQGDNVRIPHSGNKSWKDIGHIVLVSIKPIPKGKVQLKYRSKFFSNKVQKVDLDCSFMVERSREILPITKPVDEIVTIEDAANAFLQEAGAKYLCRGKAHVSIKQSTTEYMDNLIQQSRLSKKYNDSLRLYRSTISVEKIESLIELCKFGRETTSFLRKDEIWFPRLVDSFISK